MVQRQSRDDESYELNDTFSSRHPSDLADLSSQPDDDGAQAALLTGERVAYPPQQSLITQLTSHLPFFSRRRSPSKYVSKRRPRVCPRPSTSRRIVASTFVGLATLVLVVGLLFPSYSHPPIHYAELRSRTQSTDVLGRANPRQERVYIAASIFDKGGDLANGAWGRNILDLVDILGPENVYLSIYENDAGDAAEAALQTLKNKVTCDHTIIFEKHLSLSELPSVKLPDGSDRVKRIAYLSEVRNRALRPLAETTVQYDRMLFVNDVIFDPIEAAQLLFSTNLDADGRAKYRAACAVDFINPFKYYDTFATRDYEGYGIGLPFFPWFTSAGAGVSKKGVLAGTDAVRVRSCWGGMVAFDAKYFQQPDLAKIPPTAGSESPAKITAPYLFRAEEDLYWDASECCLIHADIQSPDATQSGIYMNPYVRVAYDESTLSWLGLTRRFEKLYLPVHYIISKLIGMPWFNPRRSELAWENVEEKVWVPAPGDPGGGAFRMVKRVASHSGFCGRRALQVMKTDTSGGGKPWEFIPVPE